MWEQKNGRNWLDSGIELKGNAIDKAIFRKVTKEINLAVSVMLECDLKLFG